MLGMAPMVKLSVYFETMAGTHLADSVRALRDTGSADALYDEAARATDSRDIDDGDWSQLRDVARYWQVSYSRRGLLFAAFAAEAYANDFIFTRWTGQDREALRWLSPINKYVLISQLAHPDEPLTRDREPIQRLTWLFQRRDELVHAAPRSKDLTYDPDNHNPRELAISIVAVADAAAALHDDVHPNSELAHVLSERTRLLAYGARATDALPDIRDTAAPQDLVAAARKRGWT